MDSSIDIVSIANFDEYHAQQIITALDEGKHILWKNQCLNGQELDKISAAYQRAKIRGLDLKVSSNFILRREARFLALKKKLS